MKLYHIGTFVLGFLLGAALMGHYAGTRLEAAAAEMAARRVEAERTATHLAAVESAAVQCQEKLSEAGQPVALIARPIR